MDKQIIEEMAKILLETSCKGSECENCAFIKSVAEAQETCVCLKVLYNAGYRKIPEGAVVLTAEAYNRLFTKARQSEIKTIDLESIVNARKEMAEKFAERLKEKLNEWLEDNEDLNGKIDFGIAEIELIGVKSLDGEIISESLIDEICKEITGEN